MLSFRASHQCVLVALMLLLTTFAYGEEVNEKPSVIAPDSSVSTINATSYVKANKRAKLRRRQSSQQDNLKTIEPTESFVAEVEMFAGETRVVNEAKVERLAVGNGKILSAAVLDDKEILLIANDVGVSSLHIWENDGKNRRIKVTVLPGETSRVSKEIQAFLQTIPNTKVSVIGDKVAIEGDNLNDADRAKVEELAKRYPQLINFTSPIGWEKMISMDVKVVEFPTKFLREMGIKWGAVGGGVIGAVWGPIRQGNASGLQINQVSPSTSQAPITGVGGGEFSIPGGIKVLSAINVGLNAQLNMMEQNGTAVTLARPTLSTRSGTTAKFLAGGEIPYVVSNINGSTVLFKPYGVKLEVEPKVGLNGVIRAKILSEVSEVDTAFTTTIGGPALLTRRTESEFNVNQGETIVLSGLLKRNKSTSIDKLPFLGDLPILGPLFRSKRFQNDETELVVFVTPTASDRNTQAQEQSMEKANNRLENEFTPQTPKTELEKPDNQVEKGKPKAIEIPPSLIPGH